MQVNFFQTYIQKIKIDLISKF